MIISRLNSHGQLYHGVVSGLYIAISHFGVGKTWMLTYNIHQTMYHSLEYHCDYKNVAHYCMIKKFN